MQPDELLRAEWVARVSALDLYIHELIAELMLEIFEGRRSPTPAYGRFQVANQTLDRIRAATTQSEASAAFDLYVRGYLSRFTYQDPEDIAEGIRLCSGVELWNEVALALGAPPAMRVERAKDVKTQLSLIVRRRNIIAHEGDLQQTPLREPLPISRADVEVVANQIESVVTAIDRLM